MPIRKARIGLARARRQSHSFTARARRVSSAQTRLDSSLHLIAPAHSLTLPTLEGVTDSIKASYGLENALPLAEALIGRGLLAPRHFEDCKNVVEVLAKALHEVVEKVYGPLGNDAFSIEVRISDHLEEGPSRRDCLFFAWGGTDSPQYIPLRPVFEQLESHPYRDRLMATLYHWLHQAASRVCNGFGFQEAKRMYQWERELYTDARKCGEDVDLEGEVECFDPATVLSYIRNSEKLKLKAHEITAAILSIADPKLRSAFQKAHHAFTLAKRIKLPRTSPACQLLIDDEAYYMDGEPLPAVCISHWRDDAVVGWLDEFCERQFNSGVSCRAAIIRSFLPSDTRFFLQIISALPFMVQTVVALSDWVRLAEEMENEFSNRDRGPARVSVGEGDPDL